MILVEFCWCMGLPTKVTLDGEQLLIEKRELVLPGNSAALSRFKGTDPKIISNINKCIVL